MPKMTRNCLNCKNEFQYYEKIEKIYRRRNCSLKCSYITRRTFYKEATYEQKIAQLKKRFEDKVIKNDDGCWDWNGSISRGYTQISFENTSITGYRASWLIYKGKVPKDLFICHKCSNRRCTKIDHLYLGTHKQNMKDMRDQKRQAFGEKNGQSKLKNEEVIEIKELIDKGEKQVDIAKKFNVSPVTISNIKHETRWKSIDYKDRSARDEEAKLAEVAAVSTDAE